MKRSFYIVAALLAAGMVISCEDTPKNPGDFNKPSTMSIDGPITSLVTGKTYDLKVARETDTVYKYLYVLQDTILDENGDPVIGADGKPVAVDDSVYVYSKIKAKLIEMEPVYLPAEPDTFRLDINSNARWYAAAPNVASGYTTWYFNHNSSTSGGGDSELQFRTTLNRSTIRKNAAFQYIITSDSTVMYRIPFFQYGRRDQPEDL